MRSATQRGSRPLVTQPLPRSPNDNNVRRGPDGAESDARPPCRMGALKQRGLRGIRGLPLGPLR